METTVYTLYLIGVLIAYWAIWLTARQDEEIGPIHAWLGSIALAFVWPTVIGGFILFLFLVKRYERRHGIKLWKSERQRDAKKQSYSSCPCTRDGLEPGAMND